MSILLDLSSLYLPTPKLCTEWNAAEHYLIEHVRLLKSINMELEDVSTEWCNKWADFVVHETFHSISVHDNSLNISVS